MAKKPKSEEPQAAAPAAEPKPEHPWDLGVWAGRTQFKCRECPFDTLNEDAMRAHVRQHEEAKWRPMVASPILGPDGKPVPASDQQAPQAEQAAEAKTEEPGEEPAREEE